MEDSDVLIIYLKWIDIYTNNSGTLTNQPVWLRLRLQPQCPRLSQVPLQVSSASAPAIKTPGPLPRLHPAQPPRPRCSATRHLLPRQRPQSAPFHPLSRQQLPRGHRRQCQRRGSPSRSLPAWTRQPRLYWTKQTQSSRWPSSKHWWLVQQKQLKQQNWTE